MSVRTRPWWLTSPLIGVSVFLGLWGLEGLVRRDDWLRTTFFVLVITVLAVNVTRFLSSRRALPTFVGLMVSAVAIVPAFAVTAEGKSHIFPSPWAYIDLIQVFQTGIHQAATSFPPVVPGTGLAALIAAAVMGLFLAADYLAVARGASATAGIILVGPWLPAAILQYRVSIGALVVALIAWLMVMALDRNLSTSPRKPAWGNAFLSTSVTLAVVLVLAPLLVAGPGWGAFPRFEMPSATGNATRLNLAVDLRHSLTSRSSIPVMRYESTGGPPGVFKLYTLSEFDGAQWKRETPTPSLRPAADGVLWPTPVENWGQRERTRLDIEVVNLQEPNLPLPPAPRAVTIEGPWNYDSELDEVRGSQVTARDASYIVETDLNLPSAEHLLSVAAGPHPGDQQLDSRYLHVADVLNRERILSLAAEITTGETTRHGQVVALQNYLRDSSQFSYDTSVQPAGDDAISTFLDDRKGYCIHFASTMVVLARTLDIPARMGYGFLAGKATRDGSFVVERRDAHVWPEIWFPEQGWVRFEPTPAIQTGAPPAYATVPDPAPSETVEAEPRESAAPTPLPSRSPAPAIQTAIPQPPDSQYETTFSAKDDEPSPIVPLWLWLVAIAFIIATTGLWLWRRRARATRPAGTGIEDEWTTLRTRLPQALRWGDEATPYEAAEIVRAYLYQARERMAGGAGTEGSSVPELHERTEMTLTEATTAMTMLADTVARHRYAPPRSSANAGDTITARSRHWVDQVVAGTDAAQQIIG